MIIVKFENPYDKFIHGNGMVQVKKKILLSISLLLKMSKMEQSRVNL